MLKLTLPLFFFINTISFGQEIIDVLNQAEKHLDAAQYEQARYYYAIAHKKDSLKEYQIELKIFQIDSTVLHLNKDNSDLSSIFKGDAAYRDSAHLSALQHYSSAKPWAFNYIKYRVNQIVQYKPELKMKWMIFLSRNHWTLNQSDSTSYQTVRWDTTTNWAVNIAWPKEDSTNYSRHLTALIDDENWVKGQHLIMSKILQFGHRENLDTDLALLIKLRSESLHRQENSIKLLFERISKIEKSTDKNPDEIQQILKKLALFDITDSAFKTRYTQLLEVYKK